MNRSKVDFWAFRARQDLGAIEGAFKAAFAGAPAEVVIKPRRVGWQGYERSADVLLGDMGAGLVAWGGDHQRGWAYGSLSGRGCEWVGDWARAQEAADRLDGYELKRVDIAVDRFDPHGYDKAVKAYQDGHFSPPGQGGRPPKCRQNLSMNDEDGSTLYVGTRTSDKFFRGYEKGKQMIGPQISAALARGEDLMTSQAWAQRVEGIGAGGETAMFPLRDWFRYELELKPKTAPLPEDVIDRRDQYFAGAYPYLQTVLADVEAEALVMRRERGPQVDLAMALGNCQRMYGSTLFTALTAYKGDIGTLMSKVMGHKHNESLLRAGVLLVDHE
jgi:phage replication initiation protein